GGGGCLRRPDRADPAGVDRGRRVGRAGEEHGGRPDRAGHPARRRPRGAGRAPRRDLRRGTRGPGAAAGPGLGLGPPLPAGRHAAPRPRVPPPHPRGGLHRPAHPPRPPRPTEHSMSTATSTTHAAGRSREGGPILLSPTYVAIDLRRSLRNRRTLIFLVVLPVVFFLAFGGGYRKSDPEAFVYVMVSMAVYGAMIATTSTGASVSVERSLGWTRQLRLTPLRPAGYVLGKVLGSLVLGAVPVILVLGTGAVMGAQLSASAWVACAFAAWACSLVF